MIRERTESAKLFFTTAEPSACPMPPIKPLLHQDISASIIRCFYTSYNKLGFGYLEKIYVSALARELAQVGHHVGREVVVPVFYDGEVLAHCRLDMIVDNTVVVEAKAGVALAVEAERQVYNYLRATRFEVGLLLHFGPRPTFKRFLCTADRKLGFDLRQGSIAILPTRDPE